MNGCFLKLKESVNSLSNSEQRVARYILENPDKISSIAIGELAEASGTSKSAVVRMCKSLGYKGYKEFSMMLISDLANNNYEKFEYADILLCDSLETIARSVCTNNIKSIENTLSIIDINEYQKAVDAIIAADRVDFYGVGVSGLVALDAQNKFLRIHKTSVVCTDPSQQILAASGLKKGDVAVMISYSGETKDIIDHVDIIKDTGATVISLTRYGKNTLSEKADIKLYISSLETLIRSGATGSRIAQLTAIDILFSAVVSKEYAKIKQYLDKTTIALKRNKTGRIYAE
jgi:DNA-binding MurR/RpiR family transcriptional regulator